ncbi:retron system putative HNH endonuclease [Vibrio alginolyticus]|uniref:retron system putative HNH endonuclease n=1 Tax=Vibrio alginolyticus TaxID=663 RepID=UPI001BD2A5BE|nr:retron system putative HNH endonuclease [Vibrio alginolyticus]EKL9827465.1 TIGR02646 family protein [Vibrio alginolyticus]EKL9832040.1 TIGR02646 family protein [Vibrio alginolyticus]MBT0069476.1 TIGR02646 family protein [Vibrio alginolyticus]MCR9490999.1 TIGR02646 family protein [Vibrio alginolyticus]MCS0112022.1 TIGR02646 family protein [Vibrio alginolyticus]
MRPVRRGDKPQQLVINNYRDALGDLLLKISSGSWKVGINSAHYCSYCERKLPTNIAIEHIEPKDTNPLLRNTWSNFLVSCVNCNSSKGKNEVDFNELYFPDRDNTFQAFEYYLDGQIKPNKGLTDGQKQIAENTITLFGLNKKAASLNGVSTDRRKQRIDVWLLALDALEDYEKDPTNLTLKKYIIKDMVSNGFFSIWMNVFSRYPEMKNLFIDAISGTRESGCFDRNAMIITPHPNLDNLQSGGKI